MSDNERKNTILLTVIAIATLLVAMVGATFAYFTAQTSKEASANITVETSTSDSFGYGTFGDLNIIANQTNFAKNYGSQMSTTTGEVTLTANGDAEASYCYTATIKVVLNQLVYTTKDEKGDNPDAELVISISKNGKEYTQKLGDEKELKYITLDGKRVCDQTSDPSGSNCTDNQTIKGYDITELGNVTTDPQGTKTIKIPATDGQTDSNLPYVHKIEAGAKETEKDKWDVKVIFINLDSDQQENTDKIFTGSLLFETVNCNDGNPIEKP